MTIKIWYYENEMYYRICILISLDTIFIQNTSFQTTFNFVLVR